MTLSLRKENEPSSSPIVFDPAVTYRPRLPYPQALDAPFPSTEDKQQDDILETFKQVKVNLPLLEAIRYFPAYAEFLKDMCLSLIHI